MVKDTRALQLKNNYEQLKTSLPADVNIIAVSKTFPASDIRVLYELGHRDFGENRLQELIDKSLDLRLSCPDIRWHFVGNIQSNKINKLLEIPRLFALHSIDNLALLEKLIKKRDILVDCELKIFLQVNTSGEQEKSGFDKEHLPDIQMAVEKLAQDGPPLRFQGLMTMGRIRTESFEEDANKCFRYLSDLKSQLIHLNGLKDCQLSMGMSRDYKLALSWGTDWIRLGEVIFGKRGQKN